jgi:exopolysaccharide production protein ExoZ
MLVSLQYLRGIAALMIVYYHSVGPLEQLTGKSLPSYASEYGVDLFFVISGLVMWLSTYGRPMSPWEFIVNRLRRIAPLYWSITIVISAIALIAPSVLRSTRFDLSHCLASLAFVPWPHPVYPGTWPVLIPGWTLNYEMFFYALFAATLYATPTFRAFALSCTLGLLVLGNARFDGYDALTYYAQPIVLEFAFGVIIGVVYTSKFDVPGFVWLSMAIVGIALFSALPSVGVLPRLAVVGLPSAMIVAGLALFERRHRIADVALAHHLGSGSYALYLTNPIVLAVTVLLLRHSALHLHMHWSVILTLLMSGSVAAGMAVHFGVEKPLDGFIRGAIEAHRRRGGPARENGSRREGSIGAAGRV